MLRLTHIAEIAAYNFILLPLRRYPIGMTEQPKHDVVIIGGGYNGLICGT
ncbi:MAG: hypothetical protein OXP36_12165 [Gammaproteobacteria bacterium]|nr:hypothetical protein [Gammaproteobacteria bacterium]